MVSYLILCVRVLDRSTTGAPLSGSSMDRSSEKCCSGGQGVPQVHDRDVFNWDITDEDASRLNQARHRKVNKTGVELGLYEITLWQISSSSQDATEAGHVVVQKRRHVSSQR